jgi:hypothetical protein
MCRQYYEVMVSLDHRLGNCLAVARGKKVFNIAEDDEGKFMMKNILVLTGSPRLGGNCDLAANAFIKGATGAGHQVYRFDAGRKRISGCMACERCWEQGKACVIDDDFNELAELIPKADMIVYISPLYYSDVSGQMKCAVDRFYSYSTGKAPNPEKIKESMLILCGETELGTDFTGVTKVYKNMIGYKGWKNRGVLCIGRVSDKGDILKTECMEKIEDMGRNA